MDESKTTNDETSRPLLLSDEVAGAGAQRIADAVEDVPAREGAETLASLEPGKAAEVAEILDPQTAARILLEMESSRAATVLGAMDKHDASMILHELDPDDRVDILAEVPQGRRDELLSALEPEDAADVASLERYPPDTAGGIMTTEVTALYEYLTVDDAIGMLRRLSVELEQMFYVYVINRAGQLVGVLSMRDVILAMPTQRLKDIMIRSVKSVNVSMDQEDVARFMQEHGYLALPVVDAQNTLLGLITADDVQEVLIEEATEDVQKLFGAGAEERLTSPWTLSFRKRVGWLAVNLGTAFAGAAIVATFEGTIARLALLAALLPIVSAVGGNASVQAMAVTVRGLSAGAVSRRLIRQVLIREMKVGAVSGCLIGLAMFIIAMLYGSASMGGWNAAALGAVVGAAMLINVTLGCLVGTSVPVMMSRFGFDPAQSATIFTTATTDAAGFLLLLTFATMFLL